MVFMLQLASDRLTLIHDCMLQLIPDSLTLINEMKEGKMETASWLNHLAAGARIETHCLSVFESFIKADDGRPGLKAVIDNMTGALMPFVQKGCAAIMLSSPCQAVTFVLYHVLLLCKLNLSRDINSCTAMAEQV